MTEIHGLFELPPYDSPSTIDSKWRTVTSPFESMNSIVFSLPSESSWTAIPLTSWIRSDIGPPFDAAYDYLLTEKRIDPKRIILHGRSLGGGVAVDLAAREQVAGLILESTFTTAFRVVTRYPIFPFDKFENVKKIDKVTSPVLVIHGTNDWTIPAYHGRRLFEGASEPKEALWVEGADHNNVAYKDEKLYLNTIKSFVYSLGQK